MKKRITLIDYGIGNLLSVSRAFEACGADIFLTDCPEDIVSADYLVLPGVGAFVNGMRELDNRGLAEPIRVVCASGRPVLGICLGMQMLFTESDEHAISLGLGVIPGRVEAIPNVAGNGRWRKTPHIGWSELLPPPDGMAWQKGLFAGLGDHPAGYFVHSFNCVPVSSESLLAAADYEGVQICAAVRQGNVHGCQFHPEKSGPLGLRIITNFINL